MRLKSLNRRLTENQLAARAIKRERRWLKKKARKVFDSMTFSGWTDDKPESLYWYPDGQWGRWAAYRRKDNDGNVYVFDVNDQQWRKL